MSSPRRGLHWAGLAAVGLAAVAAACQFIEDIHSRTSPVEPSSDAATPLDANPIVDSSTPPDVAPDTAIKCVPGIPPGLPQPAGGGMGGSITVTTAIQSLHYQPVDDAGMGLGYNLDCVATCPGLPSCVGAGSNCDADGGRDLAGNELLLTIDALGNSTGSGTVASQIAAGKLTIILQVSDWNGAPDDSQVTFAMFVASGIVANPDGGADAAATLPPNWDGNDVWDIDPRTVAGVVRGDGGEYTYVPRALTTQAYVTNNQIVGTLQSVQVGLGFGLVTMTNIVFVATIIPVVFPGTLNSGYRLDGQTAGRFSIHSILSLASALRDPLNPGMRVCGSDPTFQAFRTSLCTSADVMSDISRDNTGAPCDAISAALGFTALSVRLGPEHPGLAYDPGCDGGVEDCNADAF